MCISQLAVACFVTCASLWLLHPARLRNWTLPEVIRHFKSILVQLEILLLWPSQIFVPRDNTVMLGWHSAFHRFHSTRVNESERRYLFLLSVNFYALSTFSVEGGFKKSLKRMETDVETCLAVFLIKDFFKKGFLKPWNKYYSYRTVNSSMIWSLSLKDSDPFGVTGNILQSAFGGSQRQSSWSLIPGVCHLLTYHICRETMLLFNTLKCF